MRFLNIIRQDNVTDDCSTLNLSNMTMVPFSNSFDPDETPGCSASHPDPNYFVWYSDNSSAKVERLLKYV